MDLFLILKIIKKKNDEDVNESYDLERVLNLLIEDTEEWRMLDDEFDEPKENNKFYNYFIFIRVEEIIIFYYNLKWRIIQKEY